MFEDFFVSKWALIGGLIGLGSSLLGLIASVIVVVLAYRDYKTKSAAIT